MRVSMKRVISNSIRFERSTECPICFMDFINGQEVVTLACFERHVYHKNCYDEWIKFNKDNNKPTNCAYCRKPVDESKAKVKIYKYQPQRIH